MNNERGLSLVEVLIFSALLSMVVTAIVSLVVYSSQIINTAQAKVNQNALAQTVASRLNYCSAASPPVFNNIVFSPAAAGNAYSPSNIGAYQSGQFLPLTPVHGAGTFDIFSLLGTTNSLPAPPVTLLDYSMTLDAIGMFNAVAYQKNGTEHIYEVDLYAKLSMTKQGLGPQSLAPYLLAKIGIGVNATSGLIDQCFALDSLPSKSCGPTSVYLVNGFSATNGTSYAGPCVPLTAFDATAATLPATGPKGGPTPSPSPYPGPPPKSDSRVKTVLGRFEYGLKETLALHPYWYRYNGLGGTAPGELHAGVIAQELKPIAPKLVETDRIKLRPSDAAVANVLGVRYSDFEMMLINAVKAQQSKIKNLRQRIEKLQRQNAGHFCGQ